MATLQNCSSDDPVAMTGKVEPGLLRLPLELRQPIYAILFGSPRLFDLRHINSGISPWETRINFRPLSRKLYEKKKNVHESDSLVNYDYVESAIERNAYGFSVHIRDEWRTGILKVSKAISDEALDVLYGQNVFVVNVGGGSHHDLLKLGVANLRRIRSLRIVARPFGISYGKPLVFDPQLWLPLLEGLQQFWIVAQQPSAREDLCQWATWQDPIIKYISTIIPKTTIVGIDDNGRAETRAMMDKYFDPCYLKVRTVTGDSCFQRRSLSRKSGYSDSDDSDWSD